jgi:hypothetical protein
LTQVEKQEQHLLDPPECRQGGRLQIGTMAGFKSERVAGFNLECMAGFIGIRTKSRPSDGMQQPSLEYLYAATIT